MTSACSNVECRAGEVYLARIEICPRYQGRGISSGIIRALIEQAGGQGKDFVLDVLAVNHRARALYRRLGMTETAKPSDTKITMRWTLDTTDQDHPG